MKGSPPIKPIRKRLAACKPFIFTSVPTMKLFIQTHFLAIQQKHISQNQQTSCFCGLKFLLILVVYS